MLWLMKMKWGTHWTSQGFGLDPEYPQFPNALPRVLTWLKHLSSALVASEKPEIQRKKKLTWIQTYKTSFV